jgi:hypothetical protein
MGFSNAFGLIIEVSATLIMMYLILANAGGFTASMQAIGGQFIGAVRTLQGR